MAFGIDELRKYAEAGSVVHQGILGGLCLYGEEGVEIDYAEAFKWLSLAAAKGDPRPIGHLAHMYELGLGVEKDIAEAVRLYKVSARRGNSGAAVHLAEMYSQGKGVPIDHDEGLRWHLAVCHLVWEVLDFPDEMTEVKEYIASIPDIAKKLMKTLESEPVSIVRAGAAKMLGKIVGVSAIPALMKATGDDTVRYHAVLALAAFKEWDETGIPDKETVTQLLLRLSHDANDDIRTAALYSIIYGGHDTDETYNRFWDALDDSCPEVRGEAAYGLSLYETPEIIERLDDLLRNDAKIPNRYFDAAGELGDPALLPAVQIAADRWRKAKRHPLEGPLEYPGIESAIQRLSKAEMKVLRRKIH